MVEHKSEYVKIELVNGIIEAEYQPIFINIKIANDVLKSRTLFTTDKPRPMLLDGVRIKGIDKESRDFFSKPEASAGLTATAILVKSRLDKFFANFLIRVNISKASIPIRLFTAKQEALDWLEQYK
jgi:hypothetical protein